MSQLQAAQPVTKLATAKDRASASSTVVDPVISFVFVSSSFIAQQNLFVVCHTVVSYV